MSIWTDKIFKTDGRCLAYKNRIVEVVKAQDAANVRAYVEHLFKVELLETSLGDIVQVLLKHLCDVLVDEDVSLGENNLELDACISLASLMLDLMKSKKCNYPEAFYKCTYLLAASLQGNHDYREAATVRAAFKFDPEQNVSNVNKLKWYIEAARLFLVPQVDESLQAKQMVQHALVTMKAMKPQKHDEKAVTQEHVPEELEVSLMKLEAKCFDNALDFRVAAVRYFGLTSLKSAIISNVERNEFVNKAIICAILAPASAVRSELLTKLSKLESTRDLAVSDMLDKILKERIVRPDEIKAFEELLPEHCKVRNIKTGVSIVQSAMMNHNFFAASGVYKNIRFDSLGDLLGVSAEDAEKTAASMILSGAVAGSIDQVGGFIEFYKGSSSLISWDEQITDVCKEMGSVLHDIVQTHPEYSH